MKPYYSVFKQQKKAKVGIKRRLGVVWRFCLTLIFVFSLSASSSACSLALHDWQLAFNLEILLSSPILPIAEADFLVSSGLSEIVSKVLWVSGHDFLSETMLMCLPIISPQNAAIYWQPISDVSSVVAAAKQSADGTGIIGSDNCMLQIALFIDKSSKNNCMQLVVRQKSRIRCIIKSSSSPFAQEINGQAWLSVIFYQIPGRFLSISAFPVNGTSRILYEDHEYIEQLMSSGKLKRRTDEINPYECDFPNF